MRYISINVHQLLVSSFFLSFCMDTHREMQTDIAKNKSCFASMNDTQGNTNHKILKQLKCLSICSTWKHLLVHNVIICDLRYSNLFTVNSQFQLIITEQTNMRLRNFIAYMTSQMYYIIKGNAKTQLSSTYSKFYHQIYSTQWQHSSEHARNCDMPLIRFAMHSAVR